MRLAAVDVGSNTVHALVADVVRGRLVEVAHYVEMPELGAQVARTGAIGPRAKGAIRALRSVVAQARTHDYELLIAVREEDSSPLILSPRRHAPHTLIAGATGSGKSVLMQNILLAIAQSGVQLFQTVGNWRICR